MALRHNYQLVVLFQTLQTDQCDYWLRCKLSEFIAWCRGCVAWAHYEDAWRGKARWDRVDRSYGEKTPRPMAAFPTELSGGSARSVLSRRVTPTQWLREPSCVAQNKVGAGRVAGRALVMTIQDSVLEHHLVPFCWTTYMHLDVPKLNWFQRDIYKVFMYSGNHDGQNLCILSTQYIFLCHVNKVAFHWKAC